MHGLTGAGVVLPAEDVAEVGRRSSAMEREMGPRTELGRALVHRAAVLAVRLERCYRHEAASLGRASVAAVAAYDLGRKVEAQGLLDGLREDPRGNAAQLVAMPEGLDLAIEGWLDLADVLADAESPAWGLEHRSRAEALAGLRPGGEARLRIAGLSEALMSRPEEVRSGPDRRGLARLEMLELIADQIEGLEATRGGLDLSAIERGRAIAADFALFDASPAAVLARKYEASTERSLFRTLRELREVEASADANVESIEPCGKVDSSSSAEVARRLGSSLRKISDEAPPPVRMEPPVEVALEVAVPEPARRRPNLEKLRKREARRGHRAGRG